MDKEKQIEKLSNEIQDAVNGCSSYWSRLIAERLYNADYRKQEWISVDERLPDIELHGKGRYGGQRSVRVLCACKQRDGRSFVKEGYYEPCSNGAVVWRIPGSIDSVTHWMPLPEAPKMKGGAE